MQRMSSNQVSSAESWDPFSLQDTEQQRLEMALMGDGNVSHDDIRRSIDVLDQVLSEFDDIEPAYGDECLPLSESPTGDQEVPEEPPPIDRSLKPKSSPPSLPQKNRRQSFHGSSEGSPDGLHENVKKTSSAHNFNSTQTSIASKRSETSSHEYQEINSDLCPNTRSKSLVNDYDRERKRHRSNREQNFRSGDRPRQSKSETPLRKSRSEDISLLADDGHRGRRSGRRQSHQRRGRSSDRFLEHRSQSFMDPRMIPELGPLDLRLSDSNFIDPRFVDPRFSDLRFSDPRFSDPRFVDPRFFDPRFLDPSIQSQRFIDNRFIDPRFLDPPLLDSPIFLNDIQLPFDGPIGSPPGRFPMDDPMRFPHLMSPPVDVSGPISLPPTNPMDFHPHTIPPYDFSLLQDPLINPELLDYPYPLMDPQFEGFNPQLSGFNPRLKNFDPSMIPPPILNHAHFQGDIPVEFPFNYPPDFPPAQFPPRELLHFDERGRLFSNSLDPRVPTTGQWLPPTSEDARKVIHKLVRRSHHHHHHHTGSEDPRDNREKRANDSKTPKVHGDNRKNKSRSNSDSSGRSSPLNESRNRRDSQSLKSKGQREQSPHLDETEGVFRLGEAVRKDGQPHREFGGKDTVSLPHFVSGGKDSGFDETAVDESSTVTSPNNNNNNRGSTPGGVGGGFVVAGVFSDSSKMYIPAPPSPTPDYDEHAISDGEDSDIPQEPFYISSKSKKKENSPRKVSSSSNRDSLSEDSLQDVVTYDQETKPNAKKLNSLQSLMKEFQKGLPTSTKREDGSRFSDDSLEDDESSSNTSPNRNSTTDCDSKRPDDSMESLVSMDSSTTSFDYMADIHQKNMLIAAKAKRQSLNGSPTKDNKMAQFKSQDNGLLTSKVKSSLKAKDKTEKTRSEQKALGDIRGSRYQDCKSEKSKETRMMRQNSNGSSDESKNDFPKFDTIRHLIKEGLIEGLDETPPDFAPPPPPKISNSGSEERSDSGIGSTASTNNRTSESGGSDNQSEKLSTTPPKNFESFSSVQQQNKTPSPPPLPPPRDSSMSGSSYSSATSQPVTRNQSWLYKKNTEAHEVSSNKSTESNSSSKYGNNKSRKEKITHVDDLRHVKNNKNVAKDKVKTQYAIPQDNQKNEIYHKNEFNTKDSQNNEINRNIFLENNKNLQSKKKKLIEAPSAICDDQASVSSQGSRSGRFFSRFTESMKSGSGRSNSPHVGKNPQKTKRVAPKVGPQFHADIIRAPRVKGEAPQPPLGHHPPQFKSSSDSPSIAPLARDGSGRFRSIEDLPDISSGGKSLELKRPHDNDKKKKKKNSTLPPTITPSDMLEQERERMRNKLKDEAEGSKFKFNIFKGFWRRNKYSFDKM